jgi:hypothetical protein
LTTPTGGLIVVEHESGKKSGRGIEYDKTGNVLRAGIFEGEKLVSERNLDTKLYPFNAELSANSLIAQQTSEPKQDKLPPCTGNFIQSDWSNCQGKFDWGSYIYTGEFSKNRPHGRGEKRKPDGTLIVDGIWYEGVLRKELTAEVKLQAQQATATASSAQPSSAERDRLPAEVEAERKKRQELEQQLASAKERDRVTTELDAERRKRQELEEQLRVAQQSTQSNKQPVTSGIERRVALVIGNATYKVTPLKNPVNDSTDMARSLRSVGFDVIEANNTTLAQMREATRRFADKLGSSDVGLVYYSGHGVEVKGKNYLIPVNADIKREYEVVDQAFDASQFLEMMDNIRGPNNKRVNILIVDACRNNELQRSWRSTNNGLARMDAPGGTFISFATAPGRVAADGTGRNSPYTKHLLQALKQPNVPIEQVFKVVRRNVMEETKGEQIPWENSSLVGDFYFTVQR